MGSLNVSKGASTPGQTSPPTQTSIVEVHRKSRALHRGAFGCLRQAWVVNVTRGCMLGCVYCYARGYSNAPRSGTVLLYANLPDQLVMELDSPRRRSPVSWVAFNTASDCFQPHPRIQEVTRQAVGVLLERSIGVSILTKGWIPNSLISSWASHASLVHVQMGLISLDPRIHRVFEPHTAPPEERLRALGLLRKAGVQISVRVDPILPFLTDTQACIHALLEPLAREGISRVTLSYLHLRPRIADRLERELPPAFRELLLGCFQGTRGGAVETRGFTRLVPKALRVRGYDRFRGAAEKLGMEVCVCSCKNWDLPGGRCVHGWVVEGGGEEPTANRGALKQLHLFDREPFHDGSCST